jgi:hypothetical protein
MTIEPNSRGTPSSKVTQEYWDAADKPTAATIAAKMRADGWQISKATVIRRVNSGFAPVRAQGRPSKPMKTSPEINAINQVKAIAGADAAPDAVAGALLEAIRNLPPGEKDRVKELLGVDDQEIESRTSKLVKIGRLLLAEEFAQHTKMMMLMPDKAAKLYVALGTNLAPIIPPPNPDGGDGAKIVVEHNPNEPKRLSPSAQAIADFRARRGSAAA